MSEPDPAVPSRRQHNRKQLLAALAEVFQSSGYDGATLASLAAATGLGKASLYHHFPGGKEEMAATLLRDTVATLERDAFAHLGGTGSPGARLRACVDGFAEHVRYGEQDCLLVVFARGSAADRHGAAIAAQHLDWQHRLAATFEAAGLKPKRALRAAEELLSSLYGALELARLEQQPQAFRRLIKRLKKRLPD